MVGNGAAIQVGDAVLDERYEAGGLRAQPYGEQLLVPLCSGYLADTVPSRDMGQARSDTCSKCRVDSWEASQAFTPMG